MLPKKNRADRKVIEKIFKEGKFLNSPNLTFKFFIKGNTTTPQISFIAPKSVAKLAVKRNLLRRCGYNALGKYIHQFPLGISGVFVFKKYQASPIGLRPRDIVSIIENEIKNILSKIN
jgi:ribonuclease P protein component